ncbi:MAG: hypothetical protein JO283_14925 [Bradyrhizobium sp.]|nr:hypothetical protein [Bradyrhizobium sp.]
MDQSCRCCRAAAGDRAAHALGIAIVRIEVNAPEDMEKAFQAIVQEQDNAVAVLTAPQFVPMSERIASGLKHRIAGHCRVDGFVQLGGLFRHHLTELWRRTLRRRSQKDRMTWERMTQLVDDRLPKPIILHPWPSDRFAVTHPRWEPYAGKPPVRFCAGCAVKSALKSVA